MQTEAGSSDSSPRILVVDDEEPICLNCVKILSRMDFRVDYVLDGYEALKRLETESYDIVITDLKMSSLGGMEVLRRVKESCRDTMVIVITGYSTVSSAVEVMKMGAFDYLPKPFTPHELRSIVLQALDRRDLQKLNRRLSDPNRPRRAVSHRLVGSSPKIQKIVAMVGKVAPTDSTVLLYGESGTGKELVARAIHANSRRNENVFFAVDCGTLSGDLLESELFGHVKGAFTGAHRNKEGIFRRAHGGTVFLDEIGNISPDVQGKLLRFLESREFIAVGDTAIQQVDVRLIFATNRNLSELIQAGEFREDFYYRIYVYPIILPPLRERKMDILPIAYHFLRQFSKNMGKTITGFDDRAVQHLSAFHWPGNVRQLRNAVERAVILCDTDKISVKDLGLFSETGDDEQIFGHVPATSEELKEMKREIRRSAVNEIEKAFVQNALARNDWNVTRAARETGMQRTNFQSLIKKHRIIAPRRKPSDSAK